MPRSKEKLEFRLPHRRPADLERSRLLLRAGDREGVRDLRRLDSRERDRALAWLALAPRAFWRL
eukprot:2271812-Rhodomonas_salina.1